MIDKTLLEFNPRNILVIHFGQLGDVVLSLPALKAIRERFIGARVTVALGKLAAEIVELSGYADHMLAVDRVGLRDGPKLISIVKILRLLREVRRERFDLVIDLHSLYETNLLGFLSGAPKRRFAHRPGRSLDYLSNFNPPPPVEADTSPTHQIDRYLGILTPLGIKNASRLPRLQTRAADNLAVEALLTKARAETGFPLVGLFPGAGHPSRMWPLKNFVELADYLVRNDKVRVIVFAGPEEALITPEIRRLFRPPTIVMNGLSISQFASALARLAVLISNDTGPIHIAAAVGTSVVVPLNRTTPHTFIPLGDNHRFICSRAIEEITPEQVYTVAREVLATNRMDQLSAR